MPKELTAKETYKVLLGSMLNYSGASDSEKIERAKMFIKIISELTGLKVEVKE